MPAWIIPPEGRTPRGFPGREGRQKEGGASDHYRLQSPSTFLRIPQWTQTPCRTPTVTTSGFAFVPPQQRRSADVSSRTEWRRKAAGETWGHPRGEGVETPSHHCPSCACSTGLAQSLSLSTSVSLRGAGRSGQRAVAGSGLGVISKDWNSSGGKLRHF